MGKQRTAFHAIKDFNSLSQAIRQSVNLNVFKRNLFKFVICNLTEFELIYILIVITYFSFLTSS